MSASAVTTFFTSYIRDTSLASTVKCFKMVSSSRRTYAMMRAIAAVGKPTFSLLKAFLRAKVTQIQTKCLLKLSHFINRI